MICGVAVANWKNEQLEISKWFKSVDESKINKELQQILVKVFLKFVRDHATGNDSHDIRNAETAIGTGSETLDSDAVPSEITRKVHYVFAKGRYLDAKKRSYFVAEKILVEGDLDIEKI